MEISFLHAQDKYLKGYIVKKNNDTINCYIKKASVLDMESAVTVKNKADDTKFTVYKPNQLYGFQTENFGYFTSKSFRYRRVNDIMKTGNLADKEVAVYHEITAFLQILVKGQVTLYSFIDPKQKKHFYLEKDTVFKELYVKKKFASKIEQNRTVTGLVVQKNYIGILLTLFNDCPKIKNNIANTDLTENSLIKITNLYNKCKNPEKYNANKIHKTKKVLIEKSVFAGIISNQIKITGVGHDWAFRSQHEIPLNYTGGININFIFPELSYNFSLNTGVSYYFTPYKLQYDTIINSVNYHYEGDISTHYLKFPILIKYSFNKYKINPYFFVGTFLNKIFGCKNILTIHKFNDFKDVTEGKMFFSYIDGTTGKEKSTLRSFENGYSLGFGLKYKISDKLLMYSEFKYDKGTGFSSLSTFGTKSEFMSIVAGIEF